MRIIILLFSSIMVACTSTQVEQKTSESVLIKALVERGTDLTQLHPIRYHIECQSKEELVYIISQSATLGFAAEKIKNDSSDSIWYSSLQKDDMLNIANIDKAIAALTNMQTNLNCDRITWGSAVVK